VYQEAISQCAYNFGSSPRRISLLDRLTYWRVIRPQWMQLLPNDPLEKLFLNLTRLRRDGVVVWGHIIQANSLLFSSGSVNCPAEMVYSLEDGTRADPSYLSSVAADLFSLKNTKPNQPEFAPIADYLTNERTRWFGKPVPSSISPRRPCRISTIYVVRKHLPGPSRCLERPLMPIIVHPKPPYVALVLPSRYWPDDLLEWWQS
jgi:hypothetical protein